MSEVLATDAPNLRGASALGFSREGWQMRFVTGLGAWDLQSPLSVHTAGTACKIEVPAVGGVFGQGALVYLGTHGWCKAGGESGKQGEKNRFTVRIEINTTWRMNSSIFADNRNIAPNAINILILCCWGCTRGLSRGVGGIKKQEVTPAGVTFQTVRQRGGGRGDGQATESSRSCQKN